MEAGVAGVELGFGSLTELSPRPSAVIARRQDDHPQVRPVGIPAAKVTASHIGLDDFLAALVLGDQLPLAGVINQERLVESCQDSSIRLHTAQFFERLACAPYLAEQLNHFNGLKLPTLSRELSKVQLRSFPLDR